MTPEKLDDVLARLPHLTIAVVGDLFLDKYLDIDARLTEKSIETGRDAYQVVRVRCSPGAAGTVLSNLAALDVGRLVAVSVLGRDGEGFDLLRELAGRGVETELVVQAAERFTPTYTKPMLTEPGGESTELERFDTKNRTATPEHLQTAVIENLRRAVADADAFIVADQVQEPDCGVITQAVRDEIAELARNHPHTWFLADSRARIGLFRSVTLKPNAAELYRALDRPAEARPTPDTLGAAAQELARRSDARVFCTAGPEGIVYADANRAEHIPAPAVEGPLDIVGAGDSCMAGIACGLCADCTPAEAAELGNLVASITIRQLGTTGTASPDQLRAALAGRAR